MKKLLMIIPILVGLFVMGCNDNSNVAGPDQITNKTVTNKTWISLPSVNKDMSTENEFATGRYVHGMMGGRVYLVKYYWSGTGMVTIDARLNVPRNAYDGMQYISYIVNDEYAATDFNPSMEFNQFLSYDLKFANIDLSDVSDPNDVEFAYLDNNGNIQIADYDELNVNVSQGMLEVKGAKIGHFSRYGFVK